jgi:glycosyltransferase involved in cell wall biosynthesis
VLFSSYPHASAHLLALLLHRATGIPWVADFRDPMLYRNNHLDGMQTKVFSWIEKQTMRYCHKAIFTTPGAIDSYARLRYADYPADKWHLIANAFDEGNFTAAEESFKQLEVVKHDSSEADKPLTLVHAGLLYRAERDPTCFFKAVALLMKQGVIVTGKIKIIFRASGSEEYYHGLIKEHELEQIVFIEPRISYQKTLLEMFTVDGLLLFQGALCNHQIPAKVYEYFRAKKPIFALTDSLGDTANLLHNAGIDTIAPLDDEHAIAKQLSLFIRMLITEKAPIASEDFVTAQSRQARTSQLADALNLCVAE